MIWTMAAPVFVFAYANDRIADERYLRDLPRERREIKAALRDAAASRNCALIECPNATVDEVLDECQLAGRRLTVFHFAGHADGRTLLFEQPDGGAAMIRAESLAQFLGKLKRLQLVVLNGCSTGDQVAALLRSGIKAVVATTTLVGDETACRFARHFYLALAQGDTIQAAFDRATSALQVHPAGDPRDPARDQAEPLDARVDIGCEAGREEKPEPARGALHRLARDVATLPPGAGLEALWSIAGDRSTLDAPLIARRRRYPVLLAAAACVLVLGSWVTYVQVNDELKRASTACRDRGIGKECTQAGFLHWKQHALPYQVSSGRQP